MIEDVYNKNSLENGYILDQKTLGKARYGLLGTGADNGCGPIAVYNACVKFGIPCRFKDIYQYFSKKGTLFFGLLGTSPLSVITFFKKMTAQSKVSIYFNPDKVKKHRAYILLGIGLARIHKRKAAFYGHYQFIERPDEDLWMLYNPGIIKTGSLKQYIRQGTIRRFIFCLVIGLDAEGSINDDQWRAL